jgi:hypothetical protein
MTYEEAAASISEAVKNDPEFTPGAPDPLEHPAPAAEAPAAEAPAPTPDQEAAPTPEVETPATDFESPEGEPSFMEGDFNPDLLPVELQPGWKQLQGAFTRKTQELAEQRKTFEELGDPDALRQAQEFYESLQDPEYLKNFYSELGQVVREMGLVPAEEAVAPEAPPAEAPSVELPAELKQIVDSDPELQPFVDRFAQMEQRLNAFEQAAQEERQALENERLLMDQAAEIDRMVGAVREQHPEYNDDDWQAIYDRAVAFDGDVLKAAELFQADRDRIIQSWVAQKTAAPAAPLPGAGAVTESTEQEPLTLDQADKAAQAYLDANDLSEFTG